MNLMAIFNEFMITVIMAFSGVFMMKDLGNDTALNLGWVWVALACFTIAANWVLWFIVQIIQIRQKRLKIKADEVSVKKATTFGNDEAKKDDENQNHSSRYDDNFDDENNNQQPPSPEKCKVKYNDKSYSSPETTDKTMMSPNKKNSTMGLENHYDDSVEVEIHVPIEEQKSGQKKKHRRRVSNLQDEY